MKNQSECPKYMIKYVFDYAFAKKPVKADKMWEKLQLRETFVKSHKLAHLIVVNFRRNF